MAEKKEEPKELKPKPDCPECHGKGFVELVPGRPDIKVACTCKYK